MSRAHQRTVQMMNTHDAFRPIRLDDTPYAGTVRGSATTLDIEAELGGLAERGHGPAAFGVLEKVRRRLGVIRPTRLRQSNFSRG